MNLNNINELNSKFGRYLPERIISISMEIFSGKIAYVSSFGTESAIILHMISRINKNLPIVLINTYFLFDKTLEYKNRLLEKMNLTNFKEIYPDDAMLQKNDENNDLWKTNTEKCCDIRKVIPLNRELKSYDAWISGRKAYHGSDRKSLKAFESINNKVVVNPLVNFSQENVDEYFKGYNLPRHPMFEEGFLSIGCIHCTAKPTDINDLRSGRWINQTKTECGIHKRYKDGEYNDG